MGTANLLEGICTAHTHYRLFRPHTGHQLVHHAWIALRLPGNLIRRASGAQITTLEPITNWRLVRQAGYRLTSAAARQSGPLLRIVRQTANRHGI